MLKLRVFIVVLTLLPLHLVPGRGSDPAAAQSGTKIVILGSGTPNADPERFGPSVAIVVNDTPYLVDCGVGVVRRAAAAARKGVTGLAVENLSMVFITHLHSDHTLGYPDLILTPWVLDRKEPLQAYGPPGLQSMTDHILKAYAEDIKIRMDGGEPAHPSSYKVTVHEISPGIVYKDQNVTVKAFPVKHGAWPHAFGYRFETPGRTIVISGDTIASESVIENCNGCDVLIHEVYSDSGFAKRPPVWRQYHSRFHTSASALGELAAKARPKLLILYHQLMWSASEETLLSEVRARFNGTVVSAHDLDVY